MLLGLGGVLASVAIWRASILPRWSGVPFAVGLLLFVPEFYLPEWARIGHGALVAIGSIWLASAMWTVSDRAPAALPAPVAGRWSRSVLSGRTAP